MTTEHQPGSPGVDLDELERLRGDFLSTFGAEVDAAAERYRAALVENFPRLSLELRTLRARVGELESKLSGALHAVRDAVEANERLTVRAESAEARVKELEARLELREGHYQDLLDGYVQLTDERNARITDLESQLAAAREEQVKWTPLIELVLRLRNLGGLVVYADELYDCIDKITGLRKFHADGTWHTGERCDECPILGVEAKGG